MDTTPPEVSSSVVTFIGGYLGCKRCCI
jgi:hypothetical protein